MEESNEKLINSLHLNMNPALQTLKLMGSCIFDTVCITLLTFVMFVNLNLTNNYLQFSFPQPWTHKTPHILHDFDTFIIPCSKKQAGNHAFWNCRAFPFALGTSCKPIFLIVVLLLKVTFSFMVLVSLSYLSLFLPLTLYFASGTSWISLLLTFN